MGIVLNLRYLYRSSNNTRCFSATFFIFFYRFYPSFSSTYIAVLILNQLFCVLNERLMVLNYYLKLARQFGYSSCGKKRAVVVIGEVQLLQLRGIRHDNKITN